MESKKKKDLLMKKNPFISFRNFVITFLILFLVLVLFYEYILILKEVVNLLGVFEHDLINALVAYKRAVKENLCITDVLYELGDLHTERNIQADQDLVDFKRLMYSYAFLVGLNVFACWWLW